MKMFVIEREIIETFLKTIKRLIRDGKWTFIKRRKNLEGLFELGLTIAQAELEVLSLNYRHYDRGPLPDHERDGEIWEFIKHKDGLPIYIKLKIDRRGCVCLSFHPSNGPTTMPFQK